MTTPLQTRRLSSAAGVEVRGLDLADDHGPETIAEICRLLADHGVVLFRDQTMTPEEHVRFSARFGPLEETVTGNEPGDDDGLPPGVSVIKYRAGRPRTGEKWHSDLSNTVTPAAFSILHAQRVPDVGGDTMFANMYLVYESLSPRMQAMLGDLAGVHTMRGQDLMTDDPARREELVRLPPVVHPLVRTHELSRRPFLYVSERVATIEGMTSEESAPILSFLCARATAAEFVYRHRWRPDDVLMWDNRVVNHIALGDYDVVGSGRELIRTAVLDRSHGWLYEAASS
jgi:taurine dioxygenase